MVNDINLKKMYNGVIDGVVLSTKQLKEYGFTQHDITQEMFNFQGKAKKIFSNYAIFA